MKLCSVLMFLSAASTKSTIACDEMPSASGVLRGSDPSTAYAEGMAPSSNVIPTENSDLNFMIFLESTFFVSLHRSLTLLKMLDRIRD